MIPSIITVVLMALSLTLLVKLGSIMLHAEEVMEPKGHAFDKVALDRLLADPEVVAWRKAMDAAALLPRKRHP